MRKVLFRGIGVGVLSAAMVLPVANYSADTEESLWLSPTLDVPDKEDFLNKEVAKEDVIRTVNLQEISITLKAALAEIDAGIKLNLGFTEQELEKIQIQVYQDSVKKFATQAQKVSEKASEAKEVDKVLEEFHEWTNDYQQEITKDKKEKSEEEERKRKILEQEEMNRTKQINSSPTKKQSNQVVGGLEGNINEAEKVSFGVPSLESQHLTYMPYTAITAKTTPHYRLQQLAETNEEGYRTYEGAISIALGSAYGTQIGTLYDIEFSDGQVMRAILGDNKQDRHTDEKNQYRDAREVYDGKSGNIVEIIFDTTGFPDMNSVNRKINKDYPGEVVSIVKVGVAKGFEK